jgi:signal transduction histidine kinase
VKARAAPTGRLAMSPGLLVLSESDLGLLARTRLRLDRIAAPVLDAHRARAGEAGVTITTQLRPRPIAGEQVLLERLIANLVQNALKYDRPGGTVATQVGADPGTDRQKHRRRRATGRGRREGARWTRR